VPRLLILLALCNLVIGSSAFVLGGIVVPLAQDLNVSVAAAGQAMTVYALATALLAPIALVATGAWPRKHALWTSMAVFALGNLICALAPNLALLLVGRAVMGVGAMFTPLAAGIAVASVEPQRRGRALAFVFLGMSLSYAIGVPIGAWLGLRFGWQVPVGLAAAASAACALGLLLVLPAHIQAPGASFAGLPQLLRRPAVLQILGLTLLYFVAIFVVFSYIGPVLRSLVPMSGELLSITLAIFGVAGVIGTLSGGWANDRFGSVRSLTVQLTVLGTMMALVPLTAGNYPAMLATFFIWGIAGFGMMAPQQSRLASLAPAQTPILLSLNTSMLYLGTALGAAVGGAVAGAVEFRNFAWVGVPFAIVGLAILRGGTTSALQPKEAAP
jgi:DHA1 family inner membrane transport protein